MKKVKIVQVVRPEELKDINCLFQTEQGLRYITNEEALATHSNPIELQVFLGDNLIGGTHHVNRLHRQFLTRYNRTLGTGQEFAVNLNKLAGKVKGFLYIYPFVGQFTSEDLLTFAKIVKKFTLECDGDLECLTDEALNDLIEGYIAGTETL